MGADNWAACPRCESIAIAKREAFIAEVDASYGKVPASVYLENRAKADEPYDPDLNLREDYEIGIRDGCFEVGYSAYCAQCKGSFSYKYEAPAELVLPPASVAAPPNPTRRRK